MTTIEIYALRRQIETLFSCLKSRGFSFEDTQVIDSRRIKRLLVIAFCWAHRVGEYQPAQINAIKIKKHKRPAKSLFRTGLDKINEAFVQMTFDFRNTLSTLFVFLDLENKPLT